MQLRIGSHLRYRLDRGLTLVELLIYVAILGSLMTISTYLISHLIYNSKTTLKQGVVDDWGRIDYLIETDVREALTISVNGSSASSCAGTSVQSPIISLTTAYSSSPIIYYNSGTPPNQSLRRCGPAILMNGSLSSSVDKDSLVAENASISAALQSDASVLRYDVTFSSLNTTETGFARLRARSYN